MVPQDCQEENSLRSNKHVATLDQPVAVTPLACSLRHVTSGSAAKPLSEDKISSKPRKPFWYQVNNFAKSILSLPSLYLRQ